MLSGRIKTAKLLSFTLGFLLTLGLLLVSSAWAEEKKPTVEFVWEKKLEIEYSIFNQSEFLRLAENYFKVQERILLGQVGEQENVIVIVPGQEVRFFDRQGKVVKKIPLQWTENINPETGVGKREVAFLSTDGKYVGISRFSGLEISFELLDSSGNSLWREELEDGVFRKAFISQGANNVVLFLTNTGDSDTPPDTLQFFSKDGTLLREYSKPGFEINKVWMDKQEKIDASFEKGKNLFYTRIGFDGNLIWEKDITGFSTEIYISASGEYYLLSKKEGTNVYDYIFNKEGVLLSKTLIPKNSWLSPQGDFHVVEIGTEIQYTPLSSEVPLFKLDSRRLPGEEKTNTTDTSHSIHPTGQYLLISLVKEKDAAPGWIVILDSKNKKVHQLTYPRGNIVAEFSGDGKFIRVYNYAENKIMLYKFTY